MDNDVEALDENYNIDRNIRTICLVPGNLKDVVSNSPGFIQWLDVNLVKDLRGKAQQVMDAVLEIDGFDQNSLISNAMLTEKISQIAKPGKKIDPNYVKSAIDRIFSRLVGDMLSYDDVVEIPQSTLDSFLMVVREKYAEAKEGSRTELPASPRVSCENCDYFYACTADIITITEEESE